MSSAAPAPHAAPGTATRIRDAAIREFAVHGFTKTTVRGIAKAAGVSPGLVIHHFGSKDGLRTACDDYVFAAVTKTKSETVQASPLLIAEMFRNEDTRAHVDYLLKSLLDPSPQGQRFFDHFVETNERIADDGFEGFRLRKGEDRRAQAVAVAMFALAPLLMEPRMRHSLGTDDLHGSTARLIPYLTEVYRHGLIVSAPGEVDTPGPRATPTSQHDPPKSVDSEP